MQRVLSRNRCLILTFVAMTALTVLAATPTLACGSCAVGGPHLGSGDSALILQLAAGGSAGVLAALKIWWHELTRFVTRHAPDIDGQPAP